MNIIKKYLATAFPNLAMTYIQYINNKNTKILGMKNTTYGFKFTGNKSMQNGTFEPEETKLLSALLLNTDVFVDIGANVGFYCCLAKSLNKSVVAFEPDIANLQVLYTNLAANNWYDVEIFPLGLAEAPRVAALYGFGTGASLIPDWAGVSSNLNHSMIINNTRYCTIK